MDRTAIQPGALATANDPASTATQRVALPKCECGRQPQHNGGPCRLCLRHSLKPSEHVQIGAGSNVDPFANVGSTPFNYVRDSAGIPLVMPRSGRVLIGKRCDVHAFADVALGFNGDTVIGDDVKIGQHCVIGGNVTIDSRVIVCPGARIGGHSHLGKGAFIGLGAIIKPRVRIGKCAVVGAGAVVTKDVPGGTTVVGNPARKLDREVLLPVWAAAGRVA